MKVLKRIIWIGYVIIVMQREKEILYSYAIVAKPTHVMLSVILLWVEWNL